MEWSISYTKLLKEVACLFLGFDNLNLETTIIWIIFGIYLCSFTVQLYFYLGPFLSLHTCPSPKIKRAEIAVSIIIAAKNEEANIRACLEAILQQEYPHFEVVVVDDASSDTTFQLLKEFNDERLKIVRLSKSKGKKVAIQAGIEAASFENFLFTDADCVPVSGHWLKGMASGFQDGKEIILGYGRMRKASGLLNKLSRFETFLTAVQYLSAAHKGSAYMGVGRNLAYARSIYTNSEAFKRHKTLRSGDDDLLVNEMADGKNVAIVFGAPTHTLTTAEKSWKTYFYQKRRHLEAGREYRAKGRFRIVMFGLSAFLFYTILFILLLIKFYSPIILGIFVVKQLLQFWVFKGIMKDLKDEDLLPWISILEPLYLIVISIVGSSTWIWKVDKWK
jgi:glycosyltransferase involved in cell wall biosynthesis